MKEQDFYIGWMPKAPGTLTRFIRKILILILIVIVLIGTILSIQQKKFSTAAFEYGKLTEVEGLYQQYPVPSLKVVTATDAFGRSEFITIPLVGYGKFGAEGIINAIEQEKGIKLISREVVLRGTLIYSDGKTLLQIDKNDEPLLSVGEIRENKTVNRKQFGKVYLSGEILDPKCYFGVMKPGMGKPHRDCAVRCIEGGINPVFQIKNERGESNYFILLGPNGEKINQHVKDYVGEPVQLEGIAEEWDDWTVLYVKPADIKRIGGLSWSKNTAIGCGISR